MRNYIREMESIFNEAASNLTRDNVLTFNKLSCDKQLIDKLYTNSKTNSLIKLICLLAMTNDIIHIGTWNNTIIGDTYDTYTANNVLDIISDLPHNEVITIVLYNSRLDREVGVSVLKKGSSATIGYGIVSNNGINTQCINIDECIFVDTSNNKSYSDLCIIPDEVRYILHNISQIYNVFTYCKTNRKIKYVDVDFNRTKIPRKSKKIEDGKIIVRYIDLTLYIDDVKHHTSHASGYKVIDRARPQEHIRHYHGKFHKDGTYHEPFDIIVNEGVTNTSKRKVVLVNKVEYV